MPILYTDNGPVVVEPDPVKRPTRTPQQQFGFEWFGTDGSRWDLVNGPVYILSGARGFGRPPVQHWRRSGLSAGSSWSGARVAERRVYMPVEITPRDRDWITVDRAFDAAIHHDLTGSLRVTTPQGDWREIVCRYDEGAEGEYELDPLLRGKAVHPIYMTAEDPFWRGEPITVSFPYADARNFIPPGGGPPFYIMPAQMLGSAEIANPGDVPARAVWRVSGPFTGFSIGLTETDPETGEETERLVTLTTTKAAGQWVEVDMTAGTSSVLDETGKDLRDAADDLDFPAIPVGESELTTTVTGAGVGTEVSVTFIPRFFRAW